MTIAVIMAGGRSERMHASGYKDHKSLVSVLGVSLLERNLFRLLQLGFHNVFVASNARNPEISAYARGRGQLIAASFGATLQNFQETEPRGTVGAAVELASQGDDVLGIFVDNLTTIDLRGLVRHHETCHAPLTLATHLEPFRIPFGEVSVNQGSVTGYYEKPVRQILICSGIFVVSPHASDFAPSVGGTDLPQLVNDILAAGEAVAEFQDQPLWIDINHASAFRQAEELIIQNPDAFEYWIDQPHREVSNLLICSGSKVMLERKGDCWGMPEEEIVPNTEGAIAASARLARRAGIEEGTTSNFLVAFDDFEPVHRNIVRHHIFSLCPSDRACQLPGMQWFAVDEIQTEVEVNTATTRAVTWFQAL